MISDILKKFRGQATEVPQQSWQDVARQNPSVQAWWNQMIQQDPRYQNMDMIQFMQKDPSRYNYREAVLQGLFPEINPEFNKYHWSDFGKGANFQAFGESSPRQR